MGTGLVEGIRASVETPYAAAGVAEVMVPSITLTPSKKPSMSVPMEAESSSAVGWYMKIGSGSSWKMKVTRKNEEQRKPQLDDKKKREGTWLKVCGKGNVKKNGRKELYLKFGLIK